MVISLLFQPPHYLLLLPQFVQVGGVLNLSDRNKTYYLLDYCTGKGSGGHGHTKVVLEVEINYKFKLGPYTLQHNKFDIAMPPDSYPSKGSSYGRLVTGWTSRLIIPY